MDYTKETDSTIFYVKFLQALMVSDNIQLFLEEADEFGIHYTSIALLQMFSDLIEGYTTNHSLPTKIVQNILDFIYICRTPNEEENIEMRKMRIDVCNEIVCKLNLSLDKEEYPFYPALINKFYKKRIQNLYNHILYSENYEAMQTLLEHYLGLEYYILYSHTELIKDDEFLEFSCEFLLNDSYLEVIQFLLDEMPELLEDSIFLKRLKQILKENENLRKQYKGQVVEDSIAVLEDSDGEIVRDRHFWKLHRKVKAKLPKKKRDS